MIVSRSCILLSGGTVAFAVSDFNYFSYTVLGFLFISTLVYFYGRIVFLANVLRFGFDQLHDAPAPTLCSFSMPIIGGTILAVYLFCLRTYQDMKSS